MGRFAAPQVEHDSEDHGQAMPMDWDAIPDDDGAGDGVGDVNGGGFANGDHDNGLVRYDTGQQGTNGRPCDADEMESRDALLRAAEYYLEQQSSHMEQERLEAKRWARIRMITVVAVAIIAVVLKRHAPPPPPLSYHYPFSMSPDGGGTDAVDVLHSNPSIDDDRLKMPEVTQHETWASYSRHLATLLHNALSYGLSVSWYAVSNAFRYSLEEVRDGIAAHGMHVDISEMWADVQRKVTSSRDWAQLQLNERQHKSQEMSDDPNCEVPTLSKMPDDRGGLWAKATRQMASVGNLFRLPTDEVHGSLQDDDIAEDENPTLDKVSACPIRIPAANNRHALVSRDTVDTAQRWSTEDLLRQTIGTSLSPQNLALKAIAEGLDGWGKSLANAAPIELVQKMATKDRFADEETLSSWILPPAAGFLLVGPEGVGKFHTARRLAHLLLGHCRGSNEPKGEVDGVLEVNSDDHAHQDARLVRTLIVDHIQSRKGVGSVVIINHIELLPTELLMKISKVLSGKTKTVSYGQGDNHVEASCDGTVFVLTSKKWATESIFQHIQRNDGLVNWIKQRESLMASARMEVNSHLSQGSELARQMTIAPVFPFQEEDIASILQGRIEALNEKHKGVRWKRLKASIAAVKHSVGTERVDYVDLYGNEVVSEKEKAHSTSIRFATRGAHALDDNSLLSKLATETWTRPGHTLKILLDDGSLETVFSWCEVDKEGVESCEEEWRSNLV